MSNLLELIAGRDKVKIKPVSMGDIHFNLPLEREVAMEEFMRSDIALRRIVEGLNGGRLFQNVIFDSNDGLKKAGAGMHDAGFYNRDGEIAVVNLRDNAMIGIETRVGMASFFMKSGGIIYYMGMLDELNVRSGRELVVHQPKKPVEVNIYGWLQHQSTDVDDTAYIIPLIKNGIFTGVTSRSTTGTEGNGRLLLQYPNESDLNGLSQDHRSALNNMFMHQNIQSILISGN